MCALWYLIGVRGSIPENSRASETCGFEAAHRLFETRKRRVEDTAEFRRAVVASTARARVRQEKEEISPATERSGFAGPHFVSDTVSARGAERPLWSPRVCLRRAFSAARLKRGKKKKRDKSPKYNGKAVIRLDVLDSDAQRIGDSRVAGIFSRRKVEAE